VEKCRPAFENFNRVIRMSAHTMIDTNVSFGHWPWMDFSGLTAQGLAAQLESHGIDEAWVSATESILFPDPDGPDARLVAAFRACPRVVPVKTINLLLGNWRESLARAIGPLGMRLVKIFPNYHQYSLVSPAAMELASFLAEEGVPLLIALRVEDERSQYPLMKVASVPVHEIVTLAALHPRLRVLVLGAQVGEITALTAGSDNIFCDIAFAETGNVMERLLDSTPVGRLVFGSHTPFFYTRAAVRKLTGACLDEKNRQAIAFENARVLLAARI